MAHVELCGGSDCFAADESVEEVEDEADAGKGAEGLCGSIVDEVGPLLVLQDGQVFTPNQMHLHTPGLSGAVGVSLSLSV